MRGYRRLRSERRLRRIPILKDLLTRAPFEGVHEDASSTIFGAAREEAERVTRQAVLARYVGKSLTEAVLAAVGSGRPVVYAMPDEWQAVLEDQGYAVARTRSSLLWQVEMLKQLARAARTMLQMIGAGLRGRGAPRVTGSMAHFHGLGPGNLPQLAADGRSHDILSWYLRWPGRRQPVTALSHDVRAASPMTVDGVPVLYQAAIPVPANWSVLASYVSWCARATVRAAGDLLRGRWWHAMVLGDAALAAARRLQPESLIDTDYLFHNSDWILRPLWTYEAERAGARILLYFYSTNIEGFRTDLDAITTYGWAAANWPRYLVWDAQQACTIRRANGPDAAISIVGPVWFNTSAADAPRPKGASIAVFDVIPFRDSYYQMLGVEVEYYVPQTSIDFLSDICELANERRAEVLWKRKRHMGAATHRRYRRFAGAFETTDNVVPVDPAVSATRLIEVADVVISMPFTSTSLIARELGKPTCYYDPSGIVRKDDPAAHGVTVVSGRAELSAWLSLHLPPPSTPQAIPS
jgi:polysaccharide biosynthesis PFTS motif protein